MHVFMSAAETKAHMHPFAPASQTQGYRDMLESLECPGCAQAISCDVEGKHGGPFFDGHNGDMGMGQDL